MKAPRRCVFHRVCLAISLGLLASITQADTLSVAYATTHRSQGSHSIKFVNDRLSVKVHEVALRELLQEIARQSGLSVMFSGPLEDRVSLEFHELSLDKGLRRILRQQNFVVEYAEPTGKERPSALPRPKTLWIIAKGGQDQSIQRLAIEARQAEYAEEDEAPDIRVWQAALQRGDVSDREEAAEALGESGHPDAVASLRLALQDEDEDVREIAIAALTEIGGEAAARALALALRDEDASIREQAVEGLEQIGGEAAAEALAVALKDEDVYVREGVVEALGEIGGETAIRLLEQALADENESVRDAVAEVLTGLRSQRR